MTRKSIIINYKHIRKPYLTLKDRYRNKRKLKKLITRWIFAGKIVLTILIALFGWWLMNRPTLIAGAVETEHTPIRIEKMEHMALVLEEVKKDEVKKKSVARGIEKPTVRKSRIVQTGRFASTPEELSNIPENQGSCFDYVPEMSKKYGVSADLMNRIIRAESGGNPLSKNTGSTASGCSQFIRSTYAGTLKQMGKEWTTPFNSKVNVEVMAWKIAHGGIGAWNASKHKWSK